MAGISKTRQSNAQIGSFPTMFFQESQTWACPVSMEAIVYVIGGGGGGAVNGGYYDNQRNSRGGSAGGCAVSRLSLSAQNYTVTVGAGGEGDRTQSGQNGTAGGASSFSGTGITTMTANGGAGGTQSTSAQNTTAGGGTATGGNLMNNTGGGGGPNSTATGRVSGGGAVNLYGSNCHGEGNKTVYARGGSPLGTAQYGEYHTSFYDRNRARYGYNRNADLTVSFFPAMMAHQSGTTGGGRSTDLSTSTGLTYRGDAAVLALSNFRGGDTTGSYTDGYSLFNQAGPFCGGMGYQRSHHNNAFCSGQAGGIGAGGGACHSQTGTGQAASGSGGSGIIMIFPLEVRG